MGTFIIRRRTMKGLKTLKHTLNVLGLQGRTCLLKQDVKFSAQPAVAKLDSEKKRLVVDNMKGTTKEEYPWVWLRDNCQCSKCYEPGSNCRIVNLTEWDLNMKPKKVEAKEDTIEVLWEDEHRSVFDHKWLLERSFSKDSRRNYRSFLNTTQKLWGREIMDAVPTADFKAIMEDDKSLLDWLMDLDRLGFVLVKNVPIEEGPVPELQKRIAFEKLTHYGPGYSVVVRPDPVNISHTANRIFFHTDLTYYDYMPGSIFLHCIEQHNGEGGETMLSDGFHAAEILKTTEPEMYKLLSNTITYFIDVGKELTEFDKLSQYPFLIHNERGELSRINWSHFARDSHLDMDIDKVEDLYAAMRKFDDLMNAEENHIRLKMQPGDMVTVKNARVLHGRSELVGGVSGRHLQCGYMDWDEIRSTIRVKRRQLGI